MHTVYRRKTLPKNIKIANMIDFNDGIFRSTTFLLIQSCDMSELNRAEWKYYKILLFVLKYFIGDFLNTNNFQHIILTYALIHRYNDSNHNNDMLHLTWLTEI